MEGVIRQVDCEKYLEAGTKEIRESFREGGATCWQGDWRHLCRRVAFDLGLQGWLGFEWSDIRKRDNNASWSESLANGECEPMDESFLFSHPRQS